MKIQHEQIKKSLANIENCTESGFAALVEKYFDDDSIEIFVEHLERFYGIEDEDELGSLAQVMISGALVALETTEGPTVQ